MSQRDRAERGGARPLPGGLAELSVHVVHLAAHAVDRLAPPRRQLVGTEPSVVVVQRALSLLRGSVGRVAAVRRRSRMEGVRRRSDAPRTARRPSGARGGRRDRHATRRAPARRGRAIPRVAAAVPRPAWVRQARRAARCGGGARRPRATTARAAPSRRGPGVPAAAAPPSRCCRRSSSSRSLAAAPVSCCCCAVASSCISRSRSARRRSASSRIFALMSTSDISLAACRDTSPPGRAPARPGGAAARHGRGRGAAALPAHPRARHRSRRR